MNRTPWVLATLLLLPAIPVFAQNDPTEAGAGLTAPPAEKLFTLDLKDTPLRQALENLFNNAKVQYSIESEVSGFVTVRAKDLSLENALKLLLRTSSTSVTYTREGNLYKVIAGTAAGGGNPNAGNPSLITIDLRNAPLRSALEQIFATARQQYILDPQVDGLVTMKIENQPLPMAVSLLLRASGKPLTYRQAQGVYIVEPRWQPAPSPPRVRPGNPAVSPGVRGVVLAIRNLPAADLLRQLTPIRPEGIDHLLVQPGTNSLVAFAGTPEDIDKLRERIALLDVASHTVLLKAEIVRVDEKNVRTVLFSTTVQGRSGNVSTVTDRANGTSAATSDVKILLTPTALDGRVDITSTWDLSLPLAGTKGGTVRLEKSISTTTQLKPGVLTLVGETKRNQNGLKDQVLLYLSAVPQTDSSPENPGATRVRL